MEKKLLTIAVIQKDGRLLLGKKKRGYAEGVWNGYGGKVEPGESIEEAMARELFEESTLITKKHEKVAQISFSSDIDDYISDCHIFMVHEYDGEPIETDEMLPQWFDFDSIPYEEMWPDDLHWLPLVLAGKKVKGHFDLDGHNKIITNNLEIVEGFSEV